MKSFLSSSCKELISDFDIPWLIISQLCYYARFDKFKKSRSTLRFTCIIHNFVDHENPTSCNCLLHTLFYIVSTWNDKVVILEQEDTFISGFVCLINAILQQNWATEIFFVNDLANKTEKFHDKNCHTSKNSFDVPVSKETQLSHLSTNENKQPYIATEMSYWNFLC